MDVVGSVRVSGTITAFEWTDSEGMRKRQTVDMLQPDSKWVPPFQKLGAQGFTQLAQKFTVKLTFRHRASSI